MPQNDAAIVLSVFSRETQTNALVSSQLINPCTMHISFTYKSRHTTTQWLPHFTIYTYVQSPHCSMLILLCTYEGTVLGQVFSILTPLFFHRFCLFFCNDKFSSVLSLPSLFPSRMTNNVVFYFFSSLPSVCVYEYAKKSNSIQFICNLRKSHGPIC